MFTQDGAKLVGGESIVKRIVANPSGSESQEIFVGATLCGGPPERADTGVCPYLNVDDDHALRFEVIVQRFGAMLAADTARLDAAEGQLVVAVVE